MKPRLIFVDDDKAELDELQPLVESEYDYVRLHWPASQPTKTTVGSAPALFVLDMYLPPATGSAPEQIPGSKVLDQARWAKNISEEFSRLYDPLPEDHKGLLRETMKCIRHATSLVEDQWRALGQDPEHGLALLRAIRKDYPDVPIVFYSRKITPEYAVRALRAGATDVVQKGARMATSKRRDA